MFGGLPLALEFLCIRQKSIRVILEDWTGLTSDLSQEFLYVVLLETHPFKSTILRGEVG